MIIYKGYDGSVKQVEDIFQVDIEQDILAVGKTLIKSFRAGWFAAKLSNPAGIFYLLSSSVGEYCSNLPTTISFTYYFEIRSSDRAEKEKLARDLCSSLSKLYSGKRGQFDDSFEQATGTYIKRITFKFNVKIRRI